MLTQARYPGEVVITDGDAADGSNTPAGEPDDDFFSSWDKPAIKKPTPPISRTATPPVVGRTPSPFIKAGENGKDIARTSSPLSKTDSGEAAKPASRVTHSSALKKSAPGAKKNVLGAKKVGTKLGVKKVVAADIDFDEAEKKAKEEADRIKELGYNPEEEEAEAKKAANDTTTIVSPTPVSAPRGGYAAASHSREKSASEIERLGMGMGRLGFGQIGQAKKAAAVQQKSSGGFGSVGPIKASSNDGMFPALSGQRLDPVTNSTAEGENFARSKFGNQKSISSDEFFGKGTYDPNEQAEAKSRLQGFDGATSISSNAYFGRPEEEAAAGDYGDLETTAKDFIRKFGITAGDDLDNLTQMVGEGATKLQGAIRSYLGS